MERKRDYVLRRAQKLIKLNNHKKINLKSQNDARMYIKASRTAENGKEVKDCKYELDYDEVKRQARYDGFYAVCTGISKEEKPVGEFISINRGRWEIEAAFRLMKSNLKSRPVYVRLEEHIAAHFVTCLAALLLLRLFEKKLLKVSGKHVTADALIGTLREMRISKLSTYYSGNFRRDALTDAIHEISGARFDCELITPGTIKKYLKL